MEKFVIVEYLNNCSAITDTFKTMQRIKILDFDISNKYVVFGASSGGIFIFERFPCSMIKFIPSMEGSTSQIKISPDENHLAIANSKGLIVILENFFTDLIIRPYLQNDHEGNTVTTMNWHGNELYSGDTSGKVSAFTLAKAFFQNPSATLLHLDSIIVQIDNYQNYFLVSTKKSTYLCDAEKGKYKQIGEQIRNDDNGACFCKKIEDDPEIPSTTREIFRIAQNTKDFIPDKNIQTKIFCARPNGRLWEADFDTSVMKTFNFTNVCQKETDILSIDNSEETNIEINTCDLNNPIRLNFGKIHSISDRFIISCDTDSINIVDPFTSSLVLSKRGYKHIIGIRMLKDHIFIWTTDFEMHTVSLQNLEDLIISTLLKKQFYLCGQICLRFKHYIIDYVEKAPRLSLLLILKDKLSENDGILRELEPIFSSLEYCYKKATKILEKNSIVDIESVKIEKENSFLHSNENVISKDEARFNFNNNEIVCIYRQYNLNKLQKNAELTEYQRLVQTTAIDDIFLLFENFMKCVETETDVIKWTQIQLIKAASIKSCDIQNIQPKTLKFLTDGFLYINSSSDLYCKCSFPLPKAHKRTVQYYDVGIQLFNLLTDKKYYLNSIPYFYGYFLKEGSENLKNYTFLRLVVQFSDVNLLKDMGKKLSYDTWEEIVTLFIKLKQGICLNCSETIDSSNVWSWTELGLVMIRFIGPTNAIRLLKRYSTHINSGELTSVFFNGCIMAKAYENYPPIMNVVERCFDYDNELNAVMELYMEEKYLCQITGKGNKLEIDDLQRCSYCDLPLNGPVLSQYKKCICGSNIHYLCFIRNDKICNTCHGKIIM